MSKHAVGVGALVIALLVGCGGSAKRADVDPEPMPDNGSFSGVWSSPQYGEMHMVQTGSQVVGEYKKNERRGRFQGTVQGDLLRFQWEERRALVRGRPTITKGRGYFKYEIGEDERHYIVGEWGLDDAETGGGPWRAYKLKGREPKLRSSGGDSGGGGQQAPPPEDDYEDTAPAEEPAAADTDPDVGGETGGGNEPEPVDDALEGLDDY